VALSNCGARLVAGVRPEASGRFGHTSGADTFPFSARVTDQTAIAKILDHLGVSTPQAEKPPPPALEILRVAEHEDGWGVPAEWERAWRRKRLRPQPATPTPGLGSHDAPPSQPSARQVTAATHLFAYRFIV
jgi:hypothetical protein